MSPILAADTQDTPLWGYNMTAYDIILKKRYNEQLTKEEIEFMISGYTNGTIPDYQMSSFLMAVCINSMTREETEYLTLAMIASGQSYQLHSEIGGVCIDKHSTGGVGDKTSIIIAPICAACGIFVPKMSGRGLGHTGGTIDKLESIPGFRTDITHQQFIKIVREAGFSIMAQTPDIVPADKKIYALRDVSGTVESIPLICSSIMSKKIATGADGIVLDVKMGTGAFMKNSQDARKLGEEMCSLAARLGRRCSVLITDMNVPLGRSVGNALEVAEACDILKGRAKGDLYTVSLALAAQMLYIAGKGTPEHCLDLCRNAVDSGLAFEKLEKMVTMHGGQYQALSKYSLMGKATDSFILTSDREGYIDRIDALAVGKAALALGAGRTYKNAPIDKTAGIKFLSSVGDFVSEGDEIAILYTSSNVPIEKIADELKRSIGVSFERPTKTDPVIGRI